MVAEGRLGRKSGARLLRLRRGARTASQTPSSACGRRPWTRRSCATIDPAAAEILLRLVAQIANEAAFTLEEGIGTPADMDTAMRLGFNWPLGPLEFTGLIGARRAVELLEELRGRLGDAYRPGPAAARGGRGGGARERGAQAGDRAHREAQPRGARLAAGRCRGDFEEARRGLVAAFEPPVVEGERKAHRPGTSRSYGFLDGEPPDTAHPRLWRQGRLNRIAGLFELAPGIYQLRGFDISNMHVIEGADGIVVVDPLISAETAAAALALYREHRGERPVTGLIYTHSHVDHFGGARGVALAARRPRSGGCRSSPRRASSTTRSARTSSPAPRWAGGPATCTGRCWSAAADGQLGAGLGQTTSLGLDHPAPTHPRDRRDRAGGGGRRRAVRASSSPRAPRRRPR